MMGTDAEGHTLLPYREEGEVLLYCRRRILLVE